MPQAAPMIMLAMTAITTAMSVMSSIQQSKQLKAQAKEAKADGAELARRQRQKNEALTGEQITKLGGSGVELLGSPLDIIVEDAGKGELAARDIEVGANREARGYEQQAAAKKQEAFGSIIGGGLKMAGQAYGAFGGGGVGPAGGVSNDFGLGSSSGGSTNWDTASMSKRFTLSPGGASSGY